MPDVVLFIIENIHQGRSSQDIIVYLQEAGYDSECIIEAFAQAYAELGVGAADQALEQLVLQQQPGESQEMSPEEVRKTKLIGYAIMVVAGVLLLVIAGYLLKQIGGSFTTLPELAPEQEAPFVPSANPRLNPEPEPAEKSPAVVQDADHLRIPVLLELEYNDTNFTYNTACQIVAQQISSQQLVSCIDTADYYKFVYKKGIDTYCSDSTGNFGEIYPSQTADDEDCLGKPFTSQSATTEDQPSAESAEDRLYRALDFSEEHIEFQSSDWLYDKTLCLGEPLKIHWYASLDIGDVVLGIYQPSFGEPEVQTIGAFSATNNSQSVPGYGTYFWSVGVTRSGAVLLPGSGYRLVAQDADGQTTAESHSFSIRNCR